MVDLLSSVLRELRLDSAAYRSLSLRAPWRLRFDGGLRGVHIVVSGRCLLTLDGAPGRILGPGDLVVLPQADSHVLSSPDGAQAPMVSSLALARRTPDTLPNAVSSALRRRGPIPPIASSSDRRSRFVRDAR